MQAFQNRIASIRWPAAVAAACWLSIVLGAVLTRMPYLDEGYYTLAPFSRITRGDWGAHEIEPSASRAARPYRRSPDIG